MAYDKKFREQVLKFIDKGHSKAEAARVFEVDPKTIWEWQKLLKETGKLDNRPKEKWHKKICPIKLKAYYNENPDSYLFEAANYFDCSTTAIFTAKRRHKITRKKN